MTYGDIVHLLESKRIRQCSLYVRGVPDDMVSFSTVTKLAHNARYQIDKYPNDYLVEADEDLYRMGHPEAFVAECYVLTRDDVNSILNAISMLQANVEGYDAVFNLLARGPNEKA